MNYWYGTPEEAAPSSTSEAIAAYSPIVQEALPALLESVTDPVKQANVIQARLQNLYRMRRQFPAMSGVIDMRIRILQGKLAAVQEGVSKTREQYTSRRTFRYLGQTALVVAIMAGIALTIRLARK